MIRYTKWGDHHRAWERISYSWIIEKYFTFPALLSVFFFCFFLNRMNLKMCTCFSNLYRTHLLRRKLLAELVEDEKVAVEIARLEEEFRRLTEENRTLVTVHNERAQQLESLCLTDRTRQDSSWPLTSAEPETYETSSWRPAEIKAHPAQQQSVNQLITQKGAVFVQAWVIHSNHRRTAVIVVRLL